MRRTVRQVWIPVLLTLVALNSAYLVAFDDPTLTRVASGLLHLPLGLLAVLVVAYVAAGRRERKSTTAKAALWLGGLSLATGLLLVIFGNLEPQYPLLVVHAWVSAVAVAASIYWVARRARERAHAVLVRITTITILLSGALGIGTLLFYQPASYSIENPSLPPASMEDEAFGGSEGMFFPSSAYTTDADTIPGDFFLRSEGCGRSGCHPDAVQQWASSAHRFSSFNNQWYRKSIEYMQEVKGVEAPKWCAGCHDHALLFSGQMAQPVNDLLDLPESEAGIGCMSCHSVASVKGTMGNGGLEIAYPLLHEIAVSDNRWVQILHDFALRMDPEPHRRAFLKPFHVDQTAEFCSSCHKVHLDQPVNNYRWVRGFNTYDNWQASGISGEGARSFYEPHVAQDCSSCHMPHVASDDAGNDDGSIRDHRFLAANTALPVAYRDEEQLEATIEFLKADRLRVDIFALVGTADEVRAEFSGVRPSPTKTTFAVGEEQGLDVGAGGVPIELAPIAAPLRSGITAFRPGESIRLDVVVRSLSVGHFFPTGTVDAQEAWLEVKIIDDDDQVIFWSGRVADDGLGPVDESAHFYRSLLVDAHSNRINKRNAWAARSTVYVNLIPPGAADVAHYRLTVPKSGTTSLRVVASLNYRKFDWWHNRFAYAGVPDPSDSLATFTEDYDDRRWLATGSTADVSGEIKDIPTLPVVTMASDTVRLGIGPIVDSPELLSGPEDAARWNDYGIALLREGDLKGAERAFRSVVHLDPEYADGWVNLARVYLAEGDPDEASLALDRSDSLKPGFWKARFFRGMVYKALGAYDEALIELRAVAQRFPRDRVVQAEMGRIHFLNGELEQATVPLQKVLSIDPEDVTAHYNLMLVHRALGNEEIADEHERRYERFKDDEESMAISRAYRQKHPYDNNEALPVHEHGGPGL
jgi:Flp pilus assembly protein TadD